MYVVNPIEYVLVAAVWPSLIFAAAWLILYLTAKGIEPPLDSQEPQLVKSRIPLLGHVWGMYRDGPKYFQKTSAKTDSPIYTLKVLKGKMYIITSPRLISMVSRLSKSIDFNPFIAEVGIRATHASNEARKVIERNLDGTQGKDSYVIEIHDRSTAALAPGPEMRRLTLIVLRGAWTKSLQALEDAFASKISLNAFLRHMLTLNSTTAIYGPQNPLLMDPYLEQAFWDFDVNLNMLLLDLYPEFTARKGHIARERIAHAFKKFFDSNPIGRSSQLAEDRYLIGKKHGLNNLDLGRLEVGVGIGILVNTVPTLFYMILHIFKSPELLASLREELEQNAIVKRASKLVLSVAQIRDQCPLLNSTFQETLRHYSEGATVRLVKEDAKLGGQFLLKKGSILQIPNSVIHRDRVAWGDTSFNAYRFLKQERREQNGDASSKTSAGSYRPFGGGSTICPGRHFAQVEVTALVAMILWRFDILPTSGTELSLPQPKQDSVVEAVFPPIQDVEVLFRKRQGLDPSLQGDFEVEFD